MPEFDKDTIEKFFKSQSDNDRNELLRDALASALIKNKKQNSPEELLKFYKSYSKKNVFKEGELVRWKPGLKDRKLPKEDEPAVVVSVIDKPIFDTSRDAGSAYFNIAYDIVLGVIDPDGEFATYHYNSFRFEPYTENS